MSAERSPPKFFALLFGLSVPFWVVGAVIESPQGIAMNLPVSALMFVCPLIAASILVHREDKPGGVRRLLRRVLDVKGIKSKIWYVPIALLMPAITLLSYWVLLLAGFPLSGSGTPFLTVPILLVVFSVAAIGEETGWMGYAVDPLQERWGALKAGLILGSVWGVWHVVPLIQAHRTPEWIAWWFLSTVSARVLIIWLYNNTGRSMPPALLFHGILVVAPSLLPHYTSDYTQAVFGTVMASTALIVTLLWGPQTLTRRPRRYWPRPRLRGDTSLQRQPYADHWLEKALD